MLVRVRNRLNSFRSGERGNKLRSIDAAAMQERPSTAGTCFQIAENRIQKIDPKTAVCSPRSPAPGAAGGDSGLAWAEGTLWWGSIGTEDSSRSIPKRDDPPHHRVQPLSVTGVTWVDGELWHGTGRVTIAT